MTQYLRRYFIHSCLLFFWTFTLSIPAMAQDEDQSSSASGSGKVLITLKLLKQDGHREAVEYSVHPSNSCKACEVVNDPTYVYQNPKEINFALRVPKSVPVEIELEIASLGVRRLVLEGTDLAYTTKASSIHFELPAQTTDRINSGEFQTHLIYRGLDVRYEHADPDRRAGSYATGPFPFLQRKAAANLEFAQREAIFMLGLDTYVADEQIGTILLMGFDTNDPHGHTDYPPHMHMHMRWPEIGGTQIGHYYINEKGLLWENKVGVRGWKGGHIKPFLPGDTYNTFDLHARLVYSHTITKEGWLDVGRPGGSVCLIRPVIVEAGFDLGAVVRCPGFKEKRIIVEDDISSGRLGIKINLQQEVHKYDIDTGTLIP